MLSNKEMLVLLQQEIVFQYSSHTYLPGTHLLDWKLLQMKYFVLHLDFVEIWYTYDLLGVLSKKQQSIKVWLRKPSKRNKSQFYINMLKKYKVQKYWAPLVVLVMSILSKHFRQWR